MITPSTAYLRRRSQSLQHPSPPPPPSGNPRAVDYRPCPGVGHLNVKCQVFPTEYARFGGGVEFNCKQSTFRSKWLGKTIFTLKIDAYKRKTHQQNYFARFYNIFWSHKKTFNIEWGIWSQFWPGRAGICSSFELINVQLWSSLLKNTITLNNTCELFVVFFLTFFKRSLLMFVSKTAKK